MESIGIKTASLLTEIGRAIKDDLAHTVLYNFTLTSIYVLAALYQKDEQRASDLAKVLKVPATSFTPVLDRLENAGLIFRTPHSVDRRSVVIALTPEGKKLKRAVENAIGNAEVRYGGK